MDTSENSPVDRTTHPISSGEHIAKVYHAGMEEGRKRVLLIAAGILAARKLAMHEGGNAGASNRQRDSRRGSLAELIMAEIDKCWE
jgi:hypothetical protein